MQAFRNRLRLDSTRNGPIQPSALSSSANGVYILVGEPLPSDVVFGRGRKQTPGSELLHRLIKDNFEQYESLDRGKKMELAESIAQKIKPHGRFLQSSASETGMRWMELPDNHARERISKYCRNLRTNCQGSRIKDTPTTTRPL